MNSPIVQRIVRHVGVDLAKATFVAAILKPGSNELHSRDSFTNDSEGFRAFRFWLHARLGKDESAHVCMEATGVYWIAFATDAREAPGVSRVSVVNPQPIHAFAKSGMRRAKTDAIDALNIALFCRVCEPREWVPPSPSIARLRALAHTHIDLCGFIRKASMQHQQTQDKMAKRHYTALLRVLEREDEKVIAEMKAVTDADATLARRVTLLDSIAGIARLGAMLILAETPEALIGKPREYAAYTGLTPTIEQSGTSINRSSMSRTGNRPLRRTLFCCAVAACRCCAPFRDLKARIISRGKDKKTALVAAAHKLARIIASVLASEQPFEVGKLTVSKPSGCR